MFKNELIDNAKDAWQAADPQVKCDLVLALESCRSLGSELSAGTAPKPGTAPQTGMAHEMMDCRPVTVAQLEPGRPPRPRLVHPSAVAKRQTGRAGGRGVMLHAIAHIEFNAINLALDAVWRYRHMPIEFALDWISVAIDETRHFEMLCRELANEDLSYGDFDAHDGLWSMARRTADDLISRMALVPRVLEARGLDATPAIQRKLAAIGDQRGVAILQTLLEEEIRHVKIGDTWFRRLCNDAGKHPESTYRELLLRYEAPLPKQPMNHSARLMAGFSQSELDWFIDAESKRAK